MIIKDATFVVTGTASGIGKALAIELISYGGRVICVDKNPTNIAGQFLQIEVDLSLEVDVQRMFNEIFKSTSTVDCFIANAGFAYFEKLAEPNWAAAQQIINTNFISPFYSCLELMKRQSNNFTFVFMCSAMAWLPIPGYALYAASKSALHSFVEAFEFDKESRIHLIRVYPIATQTNFFKTGAPVPWPNQTDKQVSKAVISAIVKKKRRVYPSLIFYWFLILNRVFPFLGKIYQNIENEKRN
jgi:short-subunit dehydrogenase